MEQEIEEGNIETLAQFLQVNDGFLLNMTDLISFRNQYNVRLLQRVINIKRDGERLFRSIMDLPGHLPQTIGMMESLARERNNGEYVYQSGAEIRRHILENQ